MADPLGILWAEPQNLPRIPPRFENVPKSPHVTLAWGVAKESYLGHVGLTALITFKAECWSSENQAILCTLEDGVPFQGEIPHCTMSWASSSSAQASTEMLRRSHESKPIERIVPCMIKWVPLEDSIAVYRSQVLALMRQGMSCNGAAKSLELSPTTVRRWFKCLPEGHPQLVEYKELASKNVGGWKLGRSRKNRRGSRNV